MEKAVKPFSQWGSAGRGRSSGKSHAELKRTSSIGYGTYRPSPPRGDGNIHFFGGDATRPAAEKKAKDVVGRKRR